MKKCIGIALVLFVWLGVLVLGQRGRYDFSTPGTFDSVSIGNFTLQQDAVDNDGLELDGAIHTAIVGGKSGNLCIHEANEPAASNDSTGSRLWVDASGVLQHQKSSNAGGGSVAIATGSGDLSDYLKKDGSVGLTSDWDIGDTRKILTDEIRARDTAGLKLYDDGEKGIFVKDGGNVGIGTTDPNELLHLKTAGGNSLQYALKMQNPYGSTSEGSTGMLFQVATSGGTSEKGGIVFERKNTYGRGNIHFLLNNDANSASAMLNDAKMTVTRGGGIGFGTSPDSAWFHIKQDGSGIGFVRLEDTQTDGQTFWINNGNGSAGGVGKAGFYYGGSQRMSFEASSGNVGIGTTAADAKLDVAGDIKLDDDIYTTAWTDYGGTSTLTNISSATVNIWYKKVGNLVFVNFYISGSFNGANAAFTLPYTSKNSTNFTVRTPLRFVHDGTPDATPGMASLSPNSNTVDIYRSWTGTATWSYTYTHSVQGQFWYEAQ